MIQEQYDDLLRSSWSAQLAMLENPTVGPWLLPFATPILTFGRWQSARVATAGLNPSEREFCDEQGNQLPLPQRRLLHREWRSNETSPSRGTLAEARRLAEGYFELGNAYWLWFRGFQPVLDELGCTFAEGKACHTDYLTPFATKDGLGSVPGTIRRTLQSEGISLWRAILDLMPELRFVLGIGIGWRFMPGLFGFEEWDTIPTPFDSKGGGTSVSKPYLLHKLVYMQRRPIDLFWWRPNLGEPLTWLSATEKRRLANLMREQGHVLSS